MLSSELPARFLPEHGCPSGSYVPPHAAEQQSILSFWQTHMTHSLLPKSPTKQTTHQPDWETTMDKLWNMWRLTPLEAIMMYRTHEKYMVHDKALYQTLSFSQMASLWPENLQKQLKQDGTKAAFGKGITDNLQFQRAIRPRLEVYALYAKYSGQTKERYTTLSTQLLQQFDSAVSVRHSVGIGSKLQQ